MRLIFKKAYLLIAIISTLFLTISCWDNDSDNGVTTPTNNAPKWSKDLYLDSCERGDSLLIDLEGIAIDLDDDSLSFTFMQTSSLSSIANGFLKINAPIDTTVIKDSIEVIVSDGSLADTATFVTNFKNPVIVNSAPQWNDTIFSYTITKGEDSTFDLSLISSDADSGATLSYSIIDSASGIDTIVGSLYTITATSNTVSPYTVNIQVSDGEKTDTAKFIFTLLEPNNVPKWTDTVYNYTIVEGEDSTINLALISSDLDSGAVLTYSIIDSLSGIDTIVGSLYSIKTDSNTVSPYSVNIQVSDGKDMDTAVFTFTIVEPNNAPVFTVEKPKDLYEIEEGDSLQFMVEATDLDSTDSVTLSIDSLGSLPNKDSVSFVNGLFKWKSSVGTSGSYVISLKATDGEDITTKAVTIKVGEANIIPTITVTDSFADGLATINESETIKVDFLFNDLDVNSNLTVTPVIPTVEGLSFTFGLDSTTAELLYTPSFNTVVNADSLIIDTVKVSVSDGEDSSFYSLIITVKNVNRAPVFGTNSPSLFYTKTVGETLKIPFSATDADTEDVVTIAVDTATFKTGANISVVNDTIVWVTAIADIGPDTISLSATDGEDITSIKVAVNINEDNTAPTITIAGINNGDTLKISEVDSTGFTVVATPAVVGDNVTMSLVGTLPSTASFNSTTGNFSFKGTYDMASLSMPDMIYAYKITAQGSGSQAAVAEFSVYVKVSNVNRAPVFNSTPSGQKVGIGNDYSVVLDITDPDGDDVVLTSQLLGTVTGNQLTWHADMYSVDLGDLRSFKVKASDGVDSASIEWDVTIEAHKWELIHEDTNLISLSAYDSNTFFALTHGYVTGYKSGATKSIRLNVDTITSLDVRSYNSMIQYGNKIIVYYGFVPGSGYEMISVDSNLNMSYDTHFSVGYGGPYFAVERATGRTYTYKRAQAPMQPSPTSVIYDSNFPDSTISMSSLLTGAHSIRASRTSTNVWLCGTGNKLVRKYGSSGSWKVIESTRTYRVAEFADSTYGRVVYLAGYDDKLLYKTTNGSSTTPTINPITNAPMGIMSIAAKDETTVWALDEYGSLHFSAYSFESNKHNEENFNGTKIKQVVVSEDRKAVFAVTEDGKVYRY